MPRSTDEPTPIAHPTASEPLGPFLAFNGPAAETLVRTYQAYADATATMNSGLMSFINTRWDRNIELRDAMARCDKLASVLDLQQDWARQATQEYFAEAGRLVELTKTLTQESWKPVYAQAAHLFEQLDRPRS